ncbi:hypothetical protein SDC9_25075 [bioreactor metagenome]|uniref:Uncharacterized protein n=1 Tax=bioreactor metagenome TaxID=1076179 RepID=A0A644UJX0_9ZZZZ
MIARGKAHPITAKGAELDRFGDGRAAGAGQAEADPPLGLELGPAGAGDAGDRDRKIGGGMGKRALGHLARDLLGHRAMGGKRLGPHRDHLLLGEVRIGDEAAFEHVGAARNVGQRRRDHAAGAAFGGGDAPPLRAGRGKDFGRRHRIITP